MKNIKVLGTGCANCKATLKLIDSAAKTNGVNIELEKIEEMSEIVAYGVMSTPGVVLDGKVVHAGGIPSIDKVNEWLSGDAKQTSGGTKSTSTGGCCS